jgi:heme exporter protein A
MLSLENLVVPFSDLSHNKSGDQKITEYTSNFSLMRGIFLALRHLNKQDLKRFLECIAGFNSEKNSHIYYNGVPIAANVSLYRSQIFWINAPEYYDAEATLLQNIQFWAQIYNSEHTIELALDNFNLFDYRDVKMRQLPPHFRKRAQLASLALNHAVLWLLNEPFAELDSEGCEMLMYLIRARCEQKGLVIATISDEYSGQITLPTATWPGFWEASLLEITRPLREF